MKKTANAKEELLSIPIEHLDIKAFDPRPLVDAMERMAFQARNLNRAARIYCMMLAEPGCGVILTLAGSLVSAGLKHVVLDLVRHNMVDAIVSTGATIVDQDFFEGLGFRHYLGSPALDDDDLRELAVDRIYDTLIDEDQLRVCDQTIGRIAEGWSRAPIPAGSSSRPWGATCRCAAWGEDSIVRAAFEKGVPVFCPAFSDCSAGFGLVMHQVARPGRCLTLDSARDFLELTRVKLAFQETGLVMVGGGAPKNFAQDTVVAAELLGHGAPMHKYAVQLTVADERDGALSGSTLKEASSWGKVSTAHEQMVFGEATLTFPLLAGYAYHKGTWAGRPERRMVEVCAKA